MFTEAKLENGFTDFYEILRVFEWIQGWYKFTVHPGETMAGT